MVHVFAEGFHSSEKIQVVEVDQSRLQAQVDIAALYIDTFGVGDELAKVLHPRMFFGTEAEVVPLEDAVAPAGKKTPDRIAHERELEFVTVQSRPVMTEDQVFRGERNAGVPQDGENGARSRFGHAEPDKARPVTDGQIVAESGGINTRHGKTTRPFFIQATRQSGFRLGKIVHV